MVGTTHKVPIRIMEALNNSQHFTICGIILLLRSSEFPGEIFYWIKKLNQIYAITTTQLQLLNLRHKYVLPTLYHE